MWEGNLQLPCSFSSSNQTRNVLDKTMIEQYNQKDSYREWWRWKQNPPKHNPNFLCAFSELLSTALVKSCRAILMCPIPLILLQTACIVACFTPSVLLQPENSNVVLMDYLGKQPINPNVSFLHAIVHHIRNLLSCEILISLLTFCLIILFFSFFFH